jgi:pantoate--beta-alanine ligase
VTDSGGKKRPPRIARTKREIRDAVAAARAAGQTIGLVPTMGALHDGHLSLVERSVDACDVTVVTIFVNPTQFGPGEDLAEYPRSLETDVAALAQYGVDWVFVPSDDEMYPAGHSTFVEPPAVADRLEGEHRPGHFRGVATIVLKLFHVIPADVAYFGQKDYQQSAVIRRMVEDLDLPIRVAVCPTVRDVCGLALSSRNAYLSQGEREQALAIHRSLTAAAELIAGGERSGDVVRQHMRQVLIDAGITRIDYVSLVDGDSLLEVGEIAGPVVALVAARVGKTRLIDNVPIG